MLATVITAALVTAGSLLVGQAVLRLCGTLAWSWLAGPVGLSVLMLFASAGLHVPGRATTICVVLGLLVVASAVFVLRDPALRPPRGGLLAALPLALLVFVPFVAAGHSGTLGVGLNNDMAAHLAWAEGLRSGAIARVLEISPTYPLGPHAVVAALAQGLGAGVDEVFAGLTAASPILLGLTAQAALSRRAPWAARLVVTTLVGMPFLIAGYYGQGSFKEVMQALFVLGIVLELRAFDPGRGRLRWVPLALMVAGTLSVYTFLGLVWPIAIAGAWLAVLGTQALLGGPGRRRAAVARVRAELVPLGIATGLGLVLLVPQLPRLVRFFVDNAATNGTGINGDAGGGNLVGRLTVWSAFGIWDNPDYRLPSVDAFHSGMWAAFVLAVVLAGAVWWVRRGDWLVPLAALVCGAIWVVADHTQTPYVAAKGLVVLAPFILLIGIRPLVERDGLPGRAPAWRLVGVPLLAAVLVVKCTGSSLDALRLGLVGPRDHLVELRELRSVIGTQPTLFLGNDDFIKWELAGVPVTAPIIGIPHAPMRREKAWAYGQPFDFDSVDADQLNAASYVITTRDAAGSAPPPQLHLVRQTRSFALWRRTGSVVPRAVLAEGPAPAAKMNCKSAYGRALVRAGGVAAVRRPWVVAESPVVPAGEARITRLRLGSGQWDLVTPYASRRAVEVSAPGLRTTLPPLADRPGPRWPIGRITLARPTTVEVRMQVDDGGFLAAPFAATPTSIIATPVARERVVPLRRACGGLVDWYRTDGAPK